MCANKPPKGGSGPVGRAAVSGDRRRGPNPVARRPQTKNGLGAQLAVQCPAGATRPVERCCSQVRVQPELRAALRVRRAARVPVSPSNAAALQSDASSPRLGKLAINWSAEKITHPSVPGAPQCLFGCDRTSDKAPPGARALAAERQAAARDARTRQRRQHRSSGARNSNTHTTAVTPPGSPKAKHAPQAHEGRPLTCTSPREPAGAAAALWYV